MPTLYWNLDTNEVTAQAFDQAALQFQDTRGSVSLCVICTRGDVNSGTLVLLDSSQVVGLVLRDPANLKGVGALAGPTTFTRGTTGADGYLATVSTDTSVVRSLMHVDDGAPQELSEYAASAVLYAEPDSGGDHLESLPFSWTILPRYYDTGMPSADIVAVWSSPAQLTAAIAAAAAAQPKLPTPTANGLFLTGNTDDSVAWSALPTTLTLVSLTVSGTITVGAVICGDLITSAGFSGNGSGLTNLNASNVTSGTLAIARGGTGANSATAALTALGAEAVANRGAANGYCPLDATAKVAALYLPSYVDDVIEASTVSALPSTGESGKIYVTLDTNFEYRWSGSTYVQIVSSPGTTDALAEGSTNLYFTAARAVSAVGGKLHPVVYSSGSTGTAISYSGGAGAVSVSVGQNQLSDTCGQVYLAFTGSSVSTGTLVATITFANAYTTQLPIVALFFPFAVFNSTTGAAISGTGTLYAVLSNTTLKIYVGEGVSGGSTFGYQYAIPPC